MSIIIKVWLLLLQSGATDKKPERIEIPPECLEAPIVRECLPDLDFRRQNSLTDEH